jgi:hypothetical protein
VPVSLGTPGHPLFTTASRGYVGGMTTLEQLMAALPTTDASHTCTATGTGSCYVGQWTVHTQHDVTLRSGKVMHCAGKTAETKLG